MPYSEGIEEKRLQLFCTMYRIKLLFQKGKQPIAYQHLHKTVSNWTYSNVKNEQILEMYLSSQQ